MRRPLYTILGLAMLAGPGTARGSDAVGRQISVYAQDPKATQVAVSRAISVLAEREPTPDAVARQFSVLVKAAEKDDAIARTIAVYSGRAASEPRGGSAARVFCANLPSLGSTAPTVTIDDPTQDEFLVAATTARAVNGTAVPNDGSLGRLVYRKNGSDWKAVTGSFTAWSFIGQLTEGDNLFQVRALNSRGGISPLQGHNVRRNAIPEAEITASACDTILLSSGGTAPFEVNASDRVGSVVRLEYQLNGGGFVPVDGAGPFNFAVPGLVAGANTIGIRVVDDLGEASPVQNCEVSRNTLPAIVVTSPAEGTQFANSVESVAVTGTVSDAVGPVTAVEWNRNGGAFTALAVAGTFSFESALDVGDNLFTIRATDSLGEVASETRLLVRVGVERWLIQ